MYFLQRILPGWMVRFPFPLHSLPLFLTLICTWGIWNKCGNWVKNGGGIDYISFIKLMFELFIIKLVVSQARRQQAPLRR